MRIRALVVGGAPGVAEIVEGLYRGGWEVTVVAPGSVRVAVGRVLSGYHGGAAGLARTIAERGIEIVVCAPAPFDTELGADAAEAARATGTPMVGYQPASILTPGCQAVACAAEAARQARATGTHVLVDCADGIIDPAEFSEDAANLYVLRRLSRSARTFPRRNRDIDPAVLPAGASHAEALARERAALVGNQIDCAVLPDTGEPELKLCVHASVELGAHTLVLSRPQLFAEDVTVFPTPQAVVRSL
ncbi:precorrin-6A/cobalt-precorrin-6A reductase [Corynebacterium atypicum]|uniref:precorrin-6A/cobalt-precorrin-6A reductase n=1 Tax=Corynebacterium atypicum TaxID=191610 RepID=UPI0009FC8854|nr:precorrin-6A/cobalt-precorrin-6A reductase [Corynebacterium atypicum]